MAENNKRTMPLRSNYRESISLLDSEILDSSNSDKLVQFLREKRGFRNAEPIFLNPSANNSKRKSFPIEIESVTSEAKTNENNKNSSNVGQPVLAANNAKHFMKPVRVSVHRLSNNLRRRVLVKDFEQMAQEEQFCPAASSTPIQQVQYNDNYGSGISNIPQGADGTIISSLLQNQSNPKFDKTSTLKQAKTMSESVLCQTGKTQSEPISNCKDQAKTNMCNESIAIDDRGYGNQEQGTLVNERQSSVTKYNEEEIIEETIINQPNISQPQLHISHTDKVPSNITPNPNRSLMINTSRKEDSLRQNNAISMSVEKKIDKFQENPQSLEVGRKSDKEATHRQHVISNRRSQVEGIRTNILNSNTEKQQQNLPSAELIIDPTLPPRQNQQLDSIRNPIIVIPIYPPCSKEIEKSVETAVLAGDTICPSPQKRSSLRSSAPYPVSSDDADMQKEKSNVSKKKHRSKRSTRPRQTIEAEITSDDDISSDNRGHIEQLPKNQRGDANQLGIGLRRSRQRSQISEESNSIHELSPRSNTNVNPVRYPLQRDTRVEHELDIFLKKVSQSTTVERNTHKSSDCSGMEPLEPLFYRSTSCDSILEGTNENIIEPVNGLSTSKHGIIYDMSPRSGRNWVGSIMKNKANKTSRLTTKGYNSLLSKKAEPHTSTYVDVEAMQRSIKNNTIGNNRRKLYSKGNSDNENSFAQNSEKLTEASRQHIQNSKQLKNVSKITLGKGKKSKYCRRTTKIRTIGFQLTDNETHETHGTHGKNKTPSSGTEGGIYFFKVPQLPVPTSKKSVGKIKNVSRKRSKLDLVSNSINNNNNNNSSSSSSGTEDSYPTYDNEFDVSSINFTKPASSNLINETYNENGNSVRNKVIPSKVISSKNDVMSKNNPPVEPDIAEEILENSAGSSGSEIITSNKKTTSVNPVLQPSTSFLNDWQSDDGIEMGEAADKLKTTTDSSRKQEMADKRSAIKSNRKINKNPSVIQAEETIAEVVNEKDNETVALHHSEPKSKAKRRNRQNMKDEMAKSKKTKLNNDTVENDTISSLRRSTRKHRPPIAYWTNRRDLDSVEICYTFKPEVVPAKKKTIPIKRKIGNRSDAMVEQTFNLNASQQFADDLFGALKKTKNYNIPGTIYENNETEMVEPNYNSAADHLFGTSKKTNCNIPETIHETETVDSNSNPTEKEAADVPSSSNSNSEQNFNKDNMLSWLQDLMQKKTNSSNMMTRTIYNLSNIKIAPTNELIFHDKGGVQYAIYKKHATSANGHGFMRLNPLSDKSRTKSKLFNLIILNLFGAVTLSSNQKKQIIKNGDLVTVPKGTYYSLKNISLNEPALLFYMQTQLE